jgi:hypothetical protein
MELRESAEGLHWATGGAGAMAAIWVQVAKQPAELWGGTEPKSWYF